MNCAYCGKKVDRGAISLLTGKVCCIGSRCNAKADAEQKAVNDSFRKEMDRPVVIKEIATIGDIDANLLPIVGILISTNQYRHPILSLKSSPALIYHSVRDAFLDNLPIGYLKTWPGKSIPGITRTERFRIIKPIPESVVLKTLARIDINLVGIHNFTTNSNGKSIQVENASKTNLLSELTANLKKKGRKK